MASDAPLKAKHMNVDMISTVMIFAAAVAPPPFFVHLIRGYIPSALSGMYTVQTSKNTDANIKYSVYSSEK